MYEAAFKGLTLPSASVLNLLEAFYSQFTTSEPCHQHKKNKPNLIHHLLSPETFPVGFQKLRKNLLTGTN